MSEGDDERVDRLRNRRRSARETGETSESSESSEVDESEKTSKTDKPSVKDELVGTYMYLPESLKQDVDRYYKKISGDYEFEYGEEMEKNRHYYQLVVRQGFKTIRDADIEEIHEMMQELDTTVSE